MFAVIIVDKTYSQLTKVNKKMHILFSFLNIIDVVFFD